MSDRHIPENPPTPAQFEALARVAAKAAGHSPQTGELELHHPQTEEEKELARRYNADVERLRLLKSENDKLGEIYATLYVNFGPNGRVLAGVLPENGLTPMQQLMEVLLVLSAKAGLVKEQEHFSFGTAGWLTPPTWENHAVDVAPVSLYTPERLEAMGLDHICMLKVGYTQYKRCRYKTRGLFDAAVAREKERETVKTT
jgi:hypothetical protein